MSFDLLPYAEVKPLTKEDFEAAVYRVGMDFGHADKMIMSKSILDQLIEALERGEYNTPPASKKEVPAKPKPCEHLWKPDYVGNNPTVCGKCGIVL